MSCVLIVEDHPIMVEALRIQVQQVLPQFECLTAGTLAEGLQLHQQHPSIALVILDLNLPDSQDMATLDAFCNLRKTGPLMVFSSSQYAHLAQFCESNRITYVPKSVEPSQFLSAVLSALTQQAQSFAMDNAAPADTPDCHDMTSLSSQQRLVLSQLARGLSCAELAKHMQISECTVRSHMHAVYQKLGVKNKSQASSRYWAWASSRGAHQTSI